MYYRVFSLRESTPDLAALLEHIHAVGHFRGDDLGWTGGTLELGDQMVTVERYLTREDDLRDDLNTWAGWLETRSDQPRHGELMQHVIGTRQLITLKAAEANRLCDETCRWLASQTNGIYQVDGQGFLAADGTMVLPDDAP
jgi:hypothetical protein